MTAKLLPTPVNDHTARLRPTAPPLDLDALAALHAARTQGEWLTSPAGNIWGPRYGALPIHDQIADVDPAGDTGNGLADAAFIVAACNALGPLLARVRAAEARVAELEAVIEERDNIAWERGEMD